MGKEIIVNVGDRETRIAVTDDGKLVELHIEREERVVGNLYKARVENVLPGMDAAFVDVSLSRNAFLHVGDVHLASHDASRSGKNVMAVPIDDDESDDDDDDDGLDDEDEDDPQAAGTDDRAAASRPRRKPKLMRRSARRQQRIYDVLKVGQEILVQVTKGPRGTKGARVSTLISLPGRYLVLMPEADNIGISRKVTDSRERDRLRKIGERMRRPGFGIILRTEAEDKPEAELQADMDLLMQMWEQIQATSKVTRAPALVHRDLTLVNKSLRDLFGSDVDRMVLDDPEEYQNANDLLGMVSPKLRGRIHLYTGDKPVFDEYGIETEIDKSLKRKVWLKSGGYLIFDETEALTVIDVNTGKFTGGVNLSETIVRTNMEAAAEIARQLRIRDIGGIIVIDFIDMGSAKDRQAVVKVLETALKRDRARTKISNITPLGLIEMTRKRTAETMTDFLSEPCVYCGGRGRLPSPETISLQVERELTRVIRDGKRDGEALVVECHPDVAELLIGEDGENVDRIECELRRAVYVRGNALQHLEKFDITAGSISDLDKASAGYRRGQFVDVRLTVSTMDPEAGVIGWCDSYLVMVPDGRKQVGQRARVKLAEVRRSFATGSLAGRG